MPLFKAGVVMWEMSPEIENWVDRIDRAHEETIGRKAIITSARDGIHSDGSLHYEGRALDFRTRDLTEQQQRKLVEALRQALGADYDVVLEPSHLHLEHDPA